MSTARYRSGNRGNIRCKWIGNTVSIAARHYVQVTDGDFQKAASSGKPAARIAAQSMHAKPRNNTPEGTADHQCNPNEKSRKAATGNYLRLEAFYGCNSLRDKGLRQVAGKYSPKVWKTDELIWR